MFLRKGGEDLKETFKGCLSGKNSICESSLTGSILKQQDRIGISGISEESQRERQYTVMGYQAIPNEPYSSTVVCTTLLLLLMCTYFRNLTILEKLCQLLS